MYGMEEYQRRHQKIDDLHAIERKRLEGQRGTVQSHWHQENERSTITVTDDWNTAIQHNLHNSWLQRQQAIEALHKNK